MLGPPNDYDEGTWTSPTTMGGGGGLGEIAGGLAGFAGSLVNAANNSAINASNQAMQKEFAQKGIRWRVNDANWAGIHPLAALGANTASYTNQVGDNSLGDGIANLGQDISRAHMATRSFKEREQILRLETERAGLQNDLLRAQIAKLNSAQIGPGMPATVPGRPFLEKGSIPDAHFADTAGGGKFPIPADKMKTRIEDNIFQEFAHFMRNNVLPNFVTDNYLRSQGKTPADKLPKGYKWGWSYLRQEYVPEKSSDYLYPDLH